MMNDDKIPMDDHLGVRASLVQSETRCTATSSPGLRSEKDHVFSATQELVGTARGHKYLLAQMVRTVQAPASAILPHWFLDRP